MLCSLPVVFYLLFDMKEHPILFSAPMVRAILEGRKTQTRRVVKFPSDFDGKDVYQNGQFGLKYSSTNMGGVVERLRPKWEVGDRLWVKETFGIHPDYNPPYNFDGQYVYRATDPDWETTEGWKWKPSIFMPRFGSRILLEITEIRAERLGAISEHDAIAEGVEFNRPPINSAASGWKHYRSGLSNAKNAVHSFETLWEKINGESSLELNPFVWVITFIRL